MMATSMSGAVCALSLFSTLAFGAQTSASAAPQPFIPATSSELLFDFPGVHIGVAEYREGPTGATVFYFPQPVAVAVDVRGGAPGTINTDALRLAYDEPFVDAITFAGGSSYGLSVATGVAEALRDRRSDPGALANIATVAGAIIFDLGPRRFSDVTPDAALGRAALAAARPGRFPLGAVGAGRFATQGGYFDARTFSGQGAAIRRSGPTQVVVFTVVKRSVMSSIARVAWCVAPVRLPTIAAPYNRGSPTDWPRSRRKTDRRGIRRSPSCSPIRGCQSGRCADSRFKCIWRWAALSNLMRQLTMATFCSPRQLQRWTIRPCRSPILDCLPRKRHGMRSWLAYRRLIRRLRRDARLSLACLRALPEPTNSPGVCS